MSERMVELRERNRAMWGSGDWDEIADPFAEVGRRLLERVGGVGAGIRLLDVGTGSGGSVAIPAAQRGADVVGCDITDAWFAAARTRAEAAGATATEWVIADAEDLPFPDACFDVVTSTFGHMFAPDQPAAARELVRVCKPGGTIGLACWTPQGNFGRFIAHIVMLMLPLPEGFRPPFLWGSEPHVTELLEPIDVMLEMRRTSLTLVFDSPEAQMQTWEANLGPVVAAKASVDAERWADTRLKMLAFLAEINERDDGAMAADYEYLETIAHPRGSSRSRSVE